MNLFALTVALETGGQIALAAVLGMVGFYLLLPRPRGRFVGGGIAALVAALAVFGAWVYGKFGNPLPDLIGTVLFWLFSVGALGFGTVLVVQKNPARGAIAFAFVILSTCGLFLLLAAPFLMAATIIIYAGAIIVTFLFLLMLSYVEGPSDENDRSREPLYGSFAGFAFVGLVLFTLHQTSQAAKPTDAENTTPQSRLLAPVLTAEERKTLAASITKLEEAEQLLDGDTNTHAARTARVQAFQDVYLPIKTDLSSVVGGAYVVDNVTVRNASHLEETGRIRPGSMHDRLVKVPGKPGEGAGLYREDEQARDALKRAATVRKSSGELIRDVGRTMDPEDQKQPDPVAAKAAVRKLRDEVVLLRGFGELPAGNVRNLGLVLYSEHLLAIELAGTLLLVAVIGAVAVTQRKGVAK